MPSLFADNDKPVGGELSAMPIDEDIDGSADLVGRIFDVLLFDEELTKKAVCIYAMQKCVKDLGVDFAADMADKISRSGCGEVSPVSVDPDKIASAVKKVLADNPDLKKQFDEVK